MTTIAMGSFDVARTQGNSLVWYAFEKDAQEFNRELMNPVHFGLQAVLVVEVLFILDPPLSALGLWSFIELGIRLLNEFKVKCVLEL